MQRNLPILCTTCYYSYSYYYIFLSFYYQSLLQSKVCAFTPTSTSSIISGNKVTFFPNSIIRRNNSISGRNYYNPNQLLPCIPKHNNLIQQGLPSISATKSVRGGYNFILQRMTMTSDANNVGLDDIGKRRKTTFTTTKTTTTDTNKQHYSYDDKNDVTSWRDKIDISIARSRKIRGGNYVQIATVDPLTLEPRCRTVVFRGFLNNIKSSSTIGDHTSSSIMKMITDKRSCKYTEVTESSSLLNTNNSSNSSKRNTAEMVWWFSKSSEQYRIRGQLKFVGENEIDQDLIRARKEQWGNLSDPAREQFFWKDPGISYPNDEDNDNADTFHPDIPTGARDANGKVLPPPDNFLLMLLYPTRCDYLRLGDNYRQVDDLLENSNWISNRVTP